MQRLLPSTVLYSEVPFSLSIHCCDKWRVTNSIVNAVTINLRYSRVVKRA